MAVVHSWPAGLWPSKGGHGWDKPLHIGVKHGQALSESNSLSGWVWVMPKGGALARYNPFYYYTLEIGIAALQRSASRKTVNLFFNSFKNELNCSAKQVLNLRKIFCIVEIGIGNGLGKVNITSGVTPAFLLSVEHASGKVN